MNRFSSIIDLQNDIRDRLQGHPGKSMTNDQLVDLEKAMAQCQQAIGELRNSWAESDQLLEEVCQGDLVGWLKDHLDAGRQPLIVDWAMAGDMIIKPNLVTFFGFNDGSDRSEEVTLALMSAFNRKSELVQDAWSDARWEQLMRQVEAAEASRLVKQAYCAATTTQEGKPVSAFLKRNSAPDHMAPIGSGRSRLVRITQWAMAVHRYYGSAAAESVLSNHLPAYRLACRWAELGVML